METNKMIWPRRVENRSYWDESQLDRTEDESPAAEVKPDHPRVLVAQVPVETGTPNHSHAWHGTWDRPMHMDENLLHPFTIARMTDHNVRGADDEVDGEDEMRRAS